MLIQPRAPAQWVLPESGQFISDISDLCMTLITCSFILVNIVLFDIRYYFLPWHEFLKYLNYRIWVCLRHITTLQSRCPINIC